MPLTKTKEFRQILKFDDFWDFTWLRINFQQHYKLQEITKCFILFYIRTKAAATAAAAKSLQSCPTLCDPIDGSPPGSTVPGILQARALEWVAISFSNAWKWKGSCSVTSDSSRPHGLQPTRLLHPWDFPGKSTGVGCHRLLRTKAESHTNTPPIREKPCNYQYDL